MIDLRMKCCPECQSTKLFRARFGGMISCRKCCAVFWNEEQPASPPFAAIGACCSSGAVRRDPWTGDERCQHCGLPVPLPNVAGAALHGAESPEPVIVARSGSDQTLTVSAMPVDDPPPILGGQGRDASEVEADGVSTVRLVVLAILSAAILALGVWAAGGGR